MPRGGPKGNKYALQHGYYTLVSKRKGGKRDLRTTFWRVFETREQEFVIALGGDLSPQEMTITTDTVWNDFYIASIDAKLADRLKEGKSLERKGKPIPLLDIRTRLAAHRRENLKVLKMERRAKEITDIAKDLQVSNRQGDAEGDT